MLRGRLPLSRVGVLARLRAVSRSSSRYSSLSFAGDGLRKVLDRARSRSPSNERHRLRIQPSTGSRNGHMKLPPMCHGATRRRRRGVRRARFSSPSLSCATPSDNGGTGSDGPVVRQRRQSSARAAPGRPSTRTPVNTSQRPVQPRVRDPVRLPSRRRGHPGEHPNSVGLLAEEWSTEDPTKLEITLASGHQVH